MQTRCAALLAVLLSLWIAVPLEAQPHLPRVAPGEVGLDAGRLEAIDLEVKKGIEEGKLPGAVVLVMRHGKIAYRRAFGLRSQMPDQVRMTEDTVFDLASLTKPVATATSVMMLLEQGKLKLNDRVAQHLPEFDRNGKGGITIDQLLLHTAGFVADNPLREYEGGGEQAWRNICELAPVAPPGTRFIYSDVGFITLGRLVEKLAGEPLDAFAQKHVFQPLGMRDTTFRPGEALKARSAPTEQQKGRWLMGEVHDPRAFLMGGVAGHAGLFATIDDLAAYVQMLLNGGELAGRRILKAETVQLMTAPRRVSGGWRALGWDVETAFSANRGDLFPLGSFGHTGFTGTSSWIDPNSQTAVLFLSNRVHPSGKGNVTRLRGQVATIAAAAIQPPLKPRARVVLPGIDVLKQEGFKRLRGKRVGLVTNHTGVDREGTSTIDLLHGAEGVKLVALFSPEHGIRGIVDAKVADSKDEKTGLPIYSLYGDRRKPTAEQLQGIDTLVFDIQDIGCRFYTYITTLGLTLEAAAEHKLRVFVLDRPNPIGGLDVAGPVLDAGKEAFTAYHRLPVRHGMTIGELALLFNSERKIGADLEVVQVQGWHRGDTFDRTGLTWINPSPNMRNLTAALLYPGVGLLETTNVSVGRGTDRPFEIIGAPWLDGQLLARSMSGKVAGVRLVPVRFTPSASTFGGKPCGGVQIIVDDWHQFEPLRFGLTLACQLRSLFPQDWQTTRYGVLLGHQQTVEAVKRGETPDAIMKSWAGDLEAFKEVRGRYLLYPDGVANRP